MKNSILIFLFLFSNTLFSQQNIFTGTLIDINTKKPIEGVLLILNSEIISYTNNQGVFSFKSPNSKEVINFTHLLYQTKSKVIYNNKVNNNIIIELNEHIIQLDEVVINNSKKQYTKRQIINNAKINYNDSYRKQPYWASINFKKINTKKEELQRYIEVSGFVFMLGEDKNVFETPIIIPLKARRTVEEKKINNTYFIPSDNFLQYRFFEQIFPLSKKGFRQLNFNVEKTMILNNELCYLINYKEKKSESTIVEGTKLKFIRGQLWVTAKEFKLKKMTSSFQFSKGTDNIYSINYVDINNKIYPKSIFYSYTFTNYPEAGKYKGELNLIEIDTTIRRNYRKTQKLTNQNYFKDSPIYNIYEKKYWKNKTLNGSRFEIGFYKSYRGYNIDSVFSKGANQIIKRQKRFGSKIIKEEKILTEIMKKDLNIK